MKIKISIMIIICSLLLSCISEHKKETKFIINETEDSVSYIDKFGLVTKISKSPKRVIIAFNSILGLWYFTGGESLTRVKGSINVPKHAKDLINLGSSMNLSLEKIISLNPDLVVLAANVTTQVKMAPLLREMGIEVMIVDTSINSFKRFNENALLFSKINRTEQLYKKKITPINDRIDNIIKISNDLNRSQKVATIFTTSKNMKIESDIALTGEMIKLLGGSNIFNKEDVVVDGKTRLTFSIESIVMSNPDIILFSTMGNIDNCKKNVEKMINENPVWNEVKAVKNGRVYYLPKKYSVYKPNQLYDEAFLHLANILYPETFIN